jgi:hypothetical protein
MGNHLTRELVFLSLPTTSWSYFYSPISCEKSLFYAKKITFFPIAEGGAKSFGVFRVKNHDFMPKNHIFSNFRGGAPGVPPAGSAPGSYSWHSCLFCHIPMLLNLFFCLFRRQVGLIFIPRDSDG